MRSQPSSSSAPIGTRPLFAAATCERTDRLRRHRRAAHPDDAALVGADLAPSAAVTRTSTPSITLPTVSGTFAWSSSATVAGLGRVVAGQELHAVALAERLGGVFVEAPPAAR